MGRRVPRARRNLRHHARQRHHRLRHPAGDLHSSWAGYAAKALPPAAFKPVGVSFVGGSITSPGMQGAHEHGNRKNPLRKLYIADRPDGRMASTMNLLLNHGVHLALEYARAATWQRRMR